MKHHLEKLQFTFKTLLQTLFDDIMIIETSSDEIKPVKKRNRKSQNNQVILDFKSSCEIVQNPSA
jgi:hypothetical protein